MPLNKKQKELCTKSQWDFSDLTALLLNCTLKPGTQVSHTEGLMNVSRAIMEENNVITEMIRPVDYHLPPGVYPDMSNTGLTEMTGLKFKRR